jgi:hypothetical protein
LAGAGFNNKLDGLGNTDGVCASNKFENINLKLKTGKTFPANKNENFEIEKQPPGRFYVD